MSPRGSPKRRSQGADQPGRMADPVNERMLLTIMQELSRDAVISLDQQGRIISWNQGAEDLLGYAAEEVLGKPLELLIPEDLQDQGEVERLFDVTQRQGFLRDYETRRMSRDGKVIHVSLTRLPLYDDDGQVKGVTAILQDITERRHMQDELVRSRTLAAIGEFSARIAHEVKNPLTGISSALSILQDAFDPKHPHHELFGEIQQQARRIDRIIDDLLTFARERTLDRQQTDLTRLARRVLNLLEASGELEGITVRRYLRQEAVVHADPSLMEDCLFNLIQNAAHSLRSQGGGHLTVAVRPGPRGVALTVTDNGPGIPADRLEQIFDPFFTTKVRGTGLGLPITRKHIEAHGGRLRVKSAPGKRTTFEVFLPTDAIAASLADGPPGPS